MDGPKVPRGTLGFVEKIVSDRLSMKPIFFLVLSHAVQPPTGAPTIPTKTMITKAGPKVLYIVDLFSVHGAPPGNSLGQNVTNPLCDVLPEGFFSNVPPGQDEIRKPSPIRADED